MSVILEKNDICKLFRNKHKYLIISHERPDGDTVGSAAALTRALRLAGNENTFMICADDIPERLSWMCADEIYGSVTANDEMRESLINQANIDKTEWMTITVDVADTKLLGALESRIDNIDLKLDHHPSRVDFGAYCYVDTDVSSCAEIIYDVIADYFQADYKIDAKIAACLYAGIISDSGNFKYPSVNSRTHQIAAKLIDSGISHSQINEKMFGKRTEQDLNALRLALDTLEIVQIDELKAAFITISNEQKQKYQLDEDHLNELKSFGRDIEGVEIGVMIKQDANDIKSYKVSMRSGNFNVSSVCETLGGGGHVRASGAVIEAPDMNEAKCIIMETIKKCKQVTNNE